MLNKKLKAKRRAAKTRIRIRQAGQVRLCIHRSLQHLYAQLIVHEEKGDRVLLSASTLEKEYRANGERTNNRETASKIGELLAKRALVKDIQKVAFDRSGYKYHGRVKALADAARAAGLIF